MIRKVSAIKFRTVTALVAVVAIGLAAAAMVPTALVEAKSVTFNDGVTVEVASSAFIPCANGGAGEVVDFGGNLQLKMDMTMDSIGGLHISRWTDPEGIKGTGRVTGDTYQGAGIARSSLYAPGPFYERGPLAPPMVATSVDSYQLIGPVEGSDLLSDAVLQLTVEDNGSVSADVFSFSFGCTDGRAATKGSSYTDGETSPHS